MNECWLGYLLKKYSERCDETFCLIVRVESLYVGIITMAGQEELQ